MTNTNTNLRGLIGNEYYNMVDLKNDIILAFETDEDVIVYNASNNVIKAYIDSPEATEYRIIIEEVDGLIVVVDVDGLTVVVVDVAKDLKKEIMDNLSGWGTLNGEEVITGAK